MGIFQWAVIRHGAKTRMGAFYISQKANHCVPEQRAPYLQASLRLLTVLIHGNYSWEIGSLRL